MKTQALTTSREELLERAGKYLAASKARNTRRAYEYDRQGFAAWCDAHGMDAARVPALAVALYLADLGPVRKASTLRRYVSSLAVYFENTGRSNPRELPQVAAMLAGIAREHGSVRREATPILRGDLADMLHEIPSPGSPRATRDRAMLLLGWAAALRESELVALDINDVRFVEPGLEVFIRARKTDRAGEGTTIPVGFASGADLCPVTAVRQWVHVLRTIGPAHYDPEALFPGVSDAGYLFARLRPRKVEKLVRSLAARAGLPLGHWTGHSLRAGFVSAASQAGIPDRTILRTTGHRSRSTLDRYVRAASLWDSVPTARLL